MAGRRSKSRVTRLVKLGGLTSRVSSSYLGQRVKGVFQGEARRSESLNALHLQNAERVVDAMGALKGAAMKVGQSLAVIADGLEVPPEVGRILGKLHDSAEPIPFSIIRDEVEAELGVPLEESFSRFDTEPLGTASLAQAHAAWLPDGTNVVVKVLHRDVEHSVDTDLAALRGLLVTGRVLRREKEELDAILEEVKARLREELDYFHEAANLEYFADALAHIEGLRVPRTHPSHCSARVLTMDRLLGAPLDTFVAQASDTARQRAGDILALTFHESLYRLRALHADPHGGNYLFDSDGTVGVVDFGCVRRYDQYWVANYARLGQSVIKGDRKTMLALSRELGILVGQTELESEDVLWELSESIARPFRTDTFLCGGDGDQVLEGVKRVVPRLLLRPELRSPPELIYLHRALTGTYTMLRRLGYRQNLGGLVRPYVRHAIAVAECRVEDGSPVIKGCDAPEPAVEATPTKSSL